MALTPEQIKDIARAKAELAAKNAQNKTDISNNVGLQNSAFTPQVAAPAQVMAPPVQQVTNNAGMINTAYDSYLQSQLAGIQGARDQANSDYQSQIDSAPQTYAPQRQKVDTATARNVQGLNMNAAAKGTAFEGGVASDQSQIRNVGEQQKTALTQQEINFVQNLKKAIADNTKAASYKEIEATGQATMAKNQALMNENIRVEDTNYNRANTNFEQNLAVKKFDLDTKVSESQLKTASLSQAGQMITNEMNEISLAIQKDPNSPENKARAINLQKAQVELQDLMTKSKYTEKEAKARIGALLANIRQSNASADATTKNAQTNADQLAWEKSATNPKNIAAGAKLALTESEITGIVSNIQNEFTVDAYNDPNSSQRVDKKINTDGIKERLQTWLQNQTYSEAAIAKMATRLGIPLVYAK